MSRVFWITAGAVAGVLVVRKLTQAAGRLTPDSAAGRVSDGLRGLTGAVREFADEVKAGMAERDAELRHALGIDSDTTGAQRWNGADAAVIDDLFGTHSRGNN